MKLKQIINYALGYGGFFLRTKKAYNYPAVFNIEPTNACPFTCVMCPRRHMKRPVGFMNIGLYKKIIDQLNGYTPRLFLHHFGDPILHPKLDEMIKYAADKGVKTEISISPVLLNPEITDKLLKSGLHIMHLSLDGTDDKTFKLIRGQAADYEKAVANTEYLIKRKNELGCRLEVGGGRYKPRTPNLEPPTLPLIEMTMIKMKHNQDQVEGFRKKWTVPGIDVVEIKNFWTWDGSDPEIVKLGIETEGTDKKKLTGGVKGPCKFAWTSMTVLWDGRVVPCCIDHDGKYILGDLNHQTLKEIWNSPQAKELRRSLAKEDMRNNRLCATCKERRKVSLLRVLGIKNQ